MKKVVIGLIGIVIVLLITGCGAVRFGTYIDTKIFPNYKISAERVKTIAPQFKESWPYVSGFISGSTWYKLTAPPIIQGIVTRLNVIHVDAMNNTWTATEQGEMAVLVIQLEHEGYKYLKDEYGATVINLVRQIASM